jgi:hypothetical protein
MDPKKEKKTFTRYKENTQISLPLSFHEKKS